MNRVTQSNLLKVAVAFLFLQTLIITLAPAVRARSLDVNYRWSQWIALLLWGLFILRAHQSILRQLPDADPYLFPMTAFLSGWGLLTLENDSLSIDMKAGELIVKQLCVHFPNDREVETSPEVIARVGEECVVLLI